jgi:hypothetical protein
MAEGEAYAQLPFLSAMIKNTMETISWQASEGDSASFFICFVRKGSVMASYRFEVKSGKKGKGVDHSDYIARNGRHRVREDLVEQGSGNMPPFVEMARDLWALADKFERSNGAVYREYVIPLPSELTSPQQHELVMALIGEFAGNRPYQYAMHAPVSSLAGELNPHLHLMVTDRVPDGIKREPEQVFTRYNAKQPGVGGWKKESGGRTRLELRNDMIMKRKKCADLQNEILAKYGHATRVDHRKLSERGIQRLPEKHLGQARIRKMSERDKKDHIASRFD